MYWKEELVVKHTALLKALFRVWWFHGTVLGIYAGNDAAHFHKHKEGMNNGLLLPALSADPFILHVAIPHIYEGWALTSVGGSNNQKEWQGEREKI